MVDAGSSRVDRPVFILGTGRSGTTLLMDMMARHPDLAWFSNYTNRFPQRPQLAAVSRLLDVDAINRGLWRKGSWVPRPAEGYRMLRYLTDGAFVEQRRLTADDVTPQVAARFRRIVEAHGRWQGKPRFMNKHTGFPRVRYLSEIFPDARFVHVLRDGRAVANSLIQVRFWDGTMKSWWWGPMNPDYEREYRESDESPAVLAGIVWKTLVAMIEESLAGLPPERCHTVRYDTILTDPRGVVERLCAFCDLPASPRFLDRVASIDVKGADDKWRRLPGREQELLRRTVEPFMKRIGLPV